MYIPASILLNNDKKALLFSKYTIYYLFWAYFVFVCECLARPNTVRVLTRTSVTHSFHLNRLHQGLAVSF